MNKKAEAFLNDFKKVLEKHKAHLELWGYDVDLSFVIDGDDTSFDTIQDENDPSICFINPESIQNSIEQYGQERDESKTR